MKLNFVLGLILGVAAITPLSFVLAAESAAGAMEVQAISSNLTGSVGLWIALLVFLWGFWKMFISGDTGAGALIMLCSVLLTVFPAVFNMAAGVFLPVIKQITGGQ